MENSLIMNGDLKNNRGGVVKPTGTTNDVSAGVSSGGGVNKISKMIVNSVDMCTKPDDCQSLLDILKAFNAPISEEQAWALIYQSICLYRDCIKRNDCHIKSVFMPMKTANLNVHKDGTVHINVENKDQSKCLTNSQKKILLNLGMVIYNALDYNIPSESACILTPELTNVISYMTLEDRDDDEGIEHDSEDDDHEKIMETNELDLVLEMCKPRVLPSNPNDHYRAVCRALATESAELIVFINKVLHGETESLRIKADAETSCQELEKLGFNDWARFWMQVVEELRQGVRLKKPHCSKPSMEFELTPYEILMEDIRTRKYNLRKVMVNGDIPPKVKKDAHAVILEFIRSRPPLKKASERKLPPLKRHLTPREQLLDSIRRGRVLKPILKNKREYKARRRLQDLWRTNRKKQFIGIAVIPTTQQETHKKSLTIDLSCEAASNSTRHRQRLIKVDISLFEDDDQFFAGTNQTKNAIPTYQQHQEQQQQQQQQSSQQPTLNKINNENNQNNINTILRRTTYDLATQCESRRASMRRHTIVGCQSSGSNNKNSCHSMPPSRPDSRQSEISTTANILNPTPSASLNDTWSKNSLDEKQWKETMNVNDRLSLTLEEVVHIRSVMTKADLEGLPVGIQVKEDVEKKKICFLCLRTRFSIFGQRGIQCKLCNRTVCTKCYTKMRIPTEHFSNVPVALLSPSLINSPVGSQVSSPSHHAHHSGSGPAGAMDENFPRSLMERLMRPELDRKTRNTVGSAPSSPKHQRSTSSTPGSTVQIESGHMSLSIASNASNGVLGAKGNTSNSSRNSIMSRSMEGPRSLPPQSPARPHSNNSTLDRRNRLAKLFIMSSSATTDQKELLRGELMSVCNDCHGLVLNIIRSQRSTRSSARNQAIRNLTLDLSPVYK